MTLWTRYIAGMVALASSAAFAQPASTPDPRTWTSSVDAARYLPCKGWRQEPDGSWNWPGTMQVGQRCAAAKKN